MPISHNHTLTDGLGLKLFLQNLAVIAIGIAHLPLPPCNDRHLLATWSLSRVTLPHLELIKLEDFIPQVIDATKEPLSFKIFRLTVADIDTLKHRARASSTQPDTLFGFNTLSALIRRCKAPSSLTNNPDRESTLLFVMDIRRPLVPPLSEMF